MTTVIGVDGCPAGWIGVIWSNTVEHRLFKSFEEILKLQADIIAVDMPIGLPPRFGREAETAARKILGKRKSSVFPIACRQAVMCETYEEARHISRASSQPPKSPTKQSFGIFRKIREIDMLLTPDLQNRVHEVHPEISFWAMNGKRDMSSSKKSKQGLVDRQSALKAAGFPIDKLPTWSYRKSQVADDDLIDACACAWSARRIFRNEHVCFPEKPPRDAKGLVMCIKA